MFAFARDGGIPGHKFFRQVDVKRGTPIRTGALHGHLNCSVRLNAECSVACLLAEFPTCSSKSRQFGRFLCSNQYHNHRLLYFIWYVTP